MHFSPSPLTTQGVEAVALRCAGYNNVDLSTALDLGMTVTHVPAYSPHAVAEVRVRVCASVHACVRGCVCVFSSDEHEGRRPCAGGLRVYGLFVLWWWMLFHTARGGPHHGAQPQDLQGTAL
jgi:hypothetical protein